MVGQMRVMPLGESVSDETLVASLGAGRQEALGSLYQRYAGLLFSVAAQSLDKSAAEELVQDVFLEVWRRAASYDPEQGPFRPWLLQLTHWRILNELRRRRRRPGTQPLEEEVWLEVLRDESPGPADRVSEAERRAALRAAMEALPQAQRQAVDLAFFGEMTHQQVASQLQVPLGTAKTRIRSGLERMRVHLAPLAAALAVVGLLGGLGVEWARTQDDLRREDRALTLVTTSDLGSLRLSAAAGVPEATHAHYWTRAGSDVAVLTTSNLAPAPNGKMYRAWVLAGGRWIALGTVTPDAGGSARLIAQDPALAEAPQGVAVTLEEQANASGPTGPVVIGWSPDGTGP